MVNYGKISMESKKGTRFDLTSETEPQMVFVPSQGNILVYNILLSILRQQRSFQTIFYPQVYELTTGLKRATLLGHYNTVTCCAYNENYQTLYSGANDRNILVWAPDSVNFVHEETISRKQPLSGPRSLIPRRELTQDAWSSDEG